MAADIGPKHYKRPERHGSRDFYRVLPIISDWHWIAIILEENTHCHIKECSGDDPQQGDAECTHKMVRNRPGPSTDCDTSTIKCALRAFVGLDPHGRV